MKRLLLCFLFAGCSYLDTPAKRHAVAGALLADAGQILTQTAINSLVNIAQQEISVGNVDWMHTAAQAAWSAGSASNLEKLINDATAGQAPAIARQAAIVAEQGIKDGDISAAEVHAAIGNVISATALK